MLLHCGRVTLRKKLRGRHEYKTGVLICEGSSKQMPYLTSVLVQPRLKQDSHWYISVMSSTCHYSGEREDSHFHCRAAVWCAIKNNCACISGIFQGQYTRCFLFSFITNLSLAAPGQKYVHENQNSQFWTLVCFSFNSLNKSIRESQKNLQYDVNNPYSIWERNFKGAELLQLICLFKKNPWKQKKSVKGAPVLKIQNLCFVSWRFSSMTVQIHSGKNMHIHPHLNASVKTIFLWPVFFNRNIVHCSTKKLSFNQRKLQRSLRVWNAFATILCY